MKIVVVSHFPEALRGFMAAAEHFDAVLPGWGDLVLFNASRELDAADAAAIPGAVAQADAVIVDLMRSDAAWRESMDPALDGYRGELIACGADFSERARLGRFTMTAFADPPSGMPGRPPRARAVDEPAAQRDAQQYSQLVRAYRTMRGDDARYVLGTLLRDYGGHPELTVPAASPHREGVFVADPATRARFAGLADYCAAHGEPAGRPVVVLLYYGQSYPTAMEPIAAAVTDALAGHAWVLPIALETTAASSLDPLQRLLCTPGYEPELIINLMSFRFGAGPTGGNPERGVQVLNQLGAPYLHPLLVSAHTVDEWRHELHSLGPSEVLVQVMLPEFDGAINEIPIAAMSPPMRDSRHGVETAELELIPAQLDRLAGRVARLLRLRRLPNADKRVALIGYDYPAGEGNLLSASQLDVAASIAAIMADLAEHGYRVRAVDAQRLRADLLANAVNSPDYVTAGQPRTYPRAQARADLANPSAWAETEAAWPASTQMPMTDPAGDFLIPAVEYDNVLVGIQPGRAPVTDDAMAHDNTVPPHPQYLAYYTWLREVWRADVIVHVGTHGTFEFLKSKENAVSVTDFPDLMLGDVPHVYLYYVGNPAEALIARRRAHACLVSYQPPVMRPGGLHDELAGLAELVASYRRSLDMAPQTSDELLAELVARAEQAHLPSDPAALESELERMSSQLIPLGLHVFGSRWSADEVRAMTCGVISNGVDDLAPGYELMAMAAGLTREQLACLTDAQLAEYEAAAVALVHRALASDEPAERIADGATGVAVVTQARKIARRFSTNDEWEFLHTALSAGYVEARLGGDPIRNPEVLPSGASLYQFDPRQVPSPLAARRGAEMAGQLRQAYRDAHDGAEPRCVGLVLWGLETTRTHGETYAEVMALLGVRATAERRPGRARWEVVPTAQLTAPRVDVVVTISGFFRDLFGTLVDELDDMFAAVASLDEPADVNPIATRTRATHERLVAAGMSEAEATELSHVRVFGPPAELYATGLTDIIDAGTWETTADLADHFTEAMQHVYSRYRHGEKVAGLYRGHLTDVQAVAQCRSSNEHHITDLDHYFEFLGGMSASVAAARGAAVPTLVADTTGRRIHTATAQDAARAGLYSQLLNPQWVEAMLAHGHQGVGEIGARTTNLLGLAATTGQMDDWMFDAVFDRFIGDAEMLARLTEANPHATADIAARLTEADRRGLWQADERRATALEEVQFAIDAELEGAGEPRSADTKRSRSVS